MKSRINLRMIKIRCTTFDHLYICIFIIFTTDSDKLDVIWILSMVLLMVFGLLLGMSMWMSESVYCVVTRNKMLKIIIQCSWFFEYIQPSNCISQKILKSFRNKHLNIFMNHKYLSITNCGRSPECLRPQTRLQYI